ncbi:MAG TPA: hypothetical protein PKD63_00260 [Solirubrobacteraceae bacterium]|nr:hypothetical protein [Solirubrobacteraceae bacterium]
MTDVAADQGAVETTTDVAADAGAAGGGEQATGGGGDRLFEAFQSFQQDVTGRLDQFEQRFEEPADDSEDPYAGLDDAAVFGDEDYDVDGQLTPEAQQRAFEQMVQQGVQAAMQPHLEAQEQSRRDAEADALETKYPVLGDPAKAGEYIDKAVQQAQLLGRPELAREPGFLEMVYLADEATKKSAAEQSAGGQQEVTLERGGGAAPADGSGGGNDDAKRIAGLAARRFSVGG